jgi:Cu/Ag efflux protein CusF
MKKFGIITLTILIAISFIGLAVAAENIIEHKGTISKIDEAAMTVTVKDAEGKEITMVVADLKMLADLKVGDRVISKYIVKDGKNICKEIAKEGPPPLGC